MVNLIFQAYQTLTEYNQTGLAGLFTYPASVWGGFIPMVLFGFFVIIVLATFFSQKRLTGSGDFLSSLAVSSFATAFVGFTMSLVDGLINTETLIVCVMLAIISVILLIIGKK